MFLARRSVAPARQLLRNQQPRRFDSHSTHHHHGPVNESFGTSFYVVIGTFTSAFILYRWSKSNQDSGSTSWISTLIEKWSPSEETFEKRNAIHTVAMEKAAADRHLFLSQGPQAHYQLRQNDLFNTGSQINVAPGSQANLTAVKEHYDRQHQQMEQARIARMQDGKVVSVYE